MTNHLRPSGREIITDRAITNNLDGEAFCNHQFQRLVALRKTFKQCNFSYSEFDAAYLRNCTFDSCDFTGCKFSNANLRGSKFIECKFDYAQFSYSHVDSEILDMECPDQENMQQIFARTLRINYSQSGDVVAANKAIRIELGATRIHLHKAWSSGESYYRKKYPGLQRAKMFVAWSKFVASDNFWGNGESPFNLLRSLVLCLVLIGSGDAYFLRDGHALSSYSGALIQSPEVLLGITKPQGFPGISLAVIASLRYVLFACFVSIFIKRMSRR